SLTPAAASTGWYNIGTGAPTVSLNCSDPNGQNGTPGSGLSTGACPASHPFGEGADQSYSASVSDVAGNSSSGGVSHVNIDLTAPVLNISGAASGTYNVCSGAPSRPTFSPSDALSGLGGSQGDGCTIPTAA